ncbi:MAG TPA: hypothetical protein VNT03_11130 [Baekduia sp.]|nr:hypothetical protein [Baekduia sp.]
MSEQGATAQAKDKAQEVAGQAQDKAQEVAGQAQDKAQEAAGQARDRIRGQIDERSTEAGQQVRTRAQDLRSVGDSLREQGKEQPAKIADQAAERLERAGGWLAESDADGIIGDVEDFARKNPWAVVAGGLALGFAVSRMLKASSSDRYRRNQHYAGGQVPRTLPATTGSEERFTRPASASATMPATTPPMPATAPTTPGPSRTTPAAGPGGI